jgi:hypothetical protein
VVCLFTDDEHQLIQVWFGASQWAPAGGSSGGIGRVAALAPETSERTPPRERSYLVESARPSPNSRSDIPLPPEFRFDGDLELQQNQKSASQRFRLKQ